MSSKYWSLGRGKTVHLKKGELNDMYFKYQTGMTPRKYSGISSER
jgi:hypothetical protein